MAAGAWYKPGAGEHITALDTVRVTCVVWSVAVCSTRVVVDVRDVVVRQWQGSVVCAGLSTSITATACRSRIVIDDSMGHCEWHLHGIVWALESSECAWCEWCWWLHLTPDFRVSFHICVCVNDVPLPSFKLLVLSGCQPAWLSITDRFDLNPLSFCHTMHVRRSTCC